MINETKVREVLKKVFDPELNFSVIDLGLVYGIEVKSGKDVFIKMTMTTPFCPYAPALLDDAKQKLGKIQGVGQIEIEVVWEPAWDTKMMTAEIREQLGIV